MYWHVKMLWQIALEFRIVVEILVEMNAGSNEDGRYGCGGVSWFNSVDDLDLKLFWVLKKIIRVKVVTKILCWTFVKNFLKWVWRVLLWLAVIAMKMFGTVFQLKGRFTWLRKIEVVIWTGMVIINMMITVKMSCNIWMIYIED